MCRVLGASIDAASNVSEYPHPYTVTSSTVSGIRCSRKVCTADTYKWDSGVELTAIAATGPTDLHPPKLAIS